MSTYIFPGQGSQFKGMGTDLFAKFPVLVKKADDILKYSIESLCLEDPQQQLNLTQFTQPALYIINALTYYSQLQEGGQKPNFVAGHSLGEYNALLAADVFDFETGLKLVKKRGELMSQASGGGMLAVIGLEADDLKTSLIQNGLINISIANYNSYTQIVVSGQGSDIALAQPLLEQAGAVMVIPLKVSGAFHSTYMQAAQVQFEAFLKDFDFSSPNIPVIANTTAEHYLTTDIHRNLIQQITQPVRWTETISYLLAQGETDFKEVGPGAVLSGLVRRIKNGK